MDWTAIICAAFASTGLFSLLQSIFQARRDKKAKNYKNEKLTSDLLVAIAQERIRWLGGHYLERGYVELDEYRCLLSIYEPYKDIGGNGVGKATMEALTLLVEDGHTSYETRRTKSAEK